MRAAVLGMKSMHLKSLRVFCDVVDRRSFSRAADANGISQSSASQMVHQLEQRLGVQLLDRSTRPFGMTAEGQRYYDGCRQIVHRYEALEQEVRAMHASEAGSLTVASIYSVGLHHMSDFLQRFSGEHPEAQVRLEYLHPHRVYEEVEKGDAELGLVSFPQATDELIFKAWRSEPMVVVCHPHCRLARGSQIEIRELGGKSFVAFERGLAIRMAIDELLAKHGVQINITHEFDNIETIKRAIEIDVGASILPERTVQRELALGTLAMAPLADIDFCRPLGIIHRRDRPLSALAEQFVGLLQADADFSTTDGATVGNVNLQNEPSFSPVR